MLPEVRINAVKHPEQMDIFIKPPFGEYYEQFPLVLVDVGASGGYKSIWDRARKHLQVIGFEPDARAFADLTRTPDPGPTRYLNIALHREKATLDFHLARKQEVSSALRFNRSLLDRFPEAERFDVLETVQIETDTLDSQLQKHQVKDVDFIKLDTQGSELFILQGATETVRDGVFGLEIEVGFAPIYYEQPLFSDVDSFVRGLGFQLMDLSPYYWKRKVGMHRGGPKGQLIFADSLYLRDPAGFAEMLGGIGDDASKRSKVLKALSICILYGYLDYALEIFDMTRELFSETEGRSITEKMRGDTVRPSRIPNFRGRGRIAGVFHALWKALRPDDPPNQGWAMSGKGIGNPG